MKKLYSKIDKDKLLHIHHKFTDDFESRLDISPEDQFLQFGALKGSTGKIYRPHKHLWNDVFYDKVIAQESWVILKGKVKVSYYDLDDSLLDVEILETGDSSITFDGGHGYEMLEDDTVIYEFKIGPYRGPALDKKFME